MKIFGNIARFLKSSLKLRTKPRTSLFAADYKEAILIKQGREQFKSLMKKGLSVPVVFL